MLSKILNPIDSLVDGISMYRLMLYYLLAVIVSAAGLSVAGNLNYNAVDILLSAGILLASCYVINRVFAFIFDAPTNPESSLITALILALIIPPTFSNFGILFLLAAAGLAIASKYIINIGEKHIFNPAAIAVALTALGPRQHATWWIGTSVMLPIVIVGGILIIRKIRHTEMFLDYLLATTFATVLLSVLNNSNPLIALKFMVLTSAVFFLGFVMLTEPYTSPTTKKHQMIYAFIVGVLVSPQFHIGNYYTSPEVALLVGNLFAYIVSSKAKLFPEFIDKVQVANNTFDFIFQPDKKLAYQPGQYMEWTLPHTHTDSRGARRYFTLASSPTEKELRIGIKFANKGSSYKAALLNFTPENTIVASQLSGDFTLPKDTRKKIAFIAGGIGITPFRSMIKYLVDKEEIRDIVMLYSARSEKDLAYKDVIEQGRRLVGVKSLYVITDRDEVIRSQYSYKAKINQHLIKKAIPDYKDRIFYISGTHDMVISIERTLLDLGLHERHIKKDYFPGY